MKKNMLLFGFFIFSPWVFSQNLDFQKIDTLYVYFEEKNPKIPTIHANDETLNALVIFLKDNPLYKMRIIGNCDDNEKKMLKENSLALSVGRAVSVKNWLVSKGIATCRLQMDAWEDENPLLMPEPKNRRFNRRVDCTFYLEESHNITLKNIPDTIQSLDSAHQELIYYPQDITPENARIIGDILENILLKNPSYGAMLCRFDVQDADYQSRAAFLFEYLSDRLRGKAFYFNRKPCHKNLISIKIYENICSDGSN